MLLFFCIALPLLLLTPHAWAHSFAYNNPWIGSKVMRVFNNFHVLLVHPMPCMVYVPPSCPCVCFCLGASVLPERKESLICMHKAFQTKIVKPHHHSGIYSWMAQCFHLCMSNHFLSFQVFATCNRTKKTSSMSFDKVLDWYICSCIEKKKRSLVVSAGCTKRRMRRSLFPYMDKHWRHLGRRASWFKFALWYPISLGWPKTKLQMGKKKKGGPSM